MCGVGQQPPPWPVADEGAPRREVGGKVVAFQGFLERAAEVHLWAPNRPWVRYPTGEKLSRRPAHGHARDVASPTEDSVVVVAIEVHDTQTAKEAFSSDAVADGVGNAHSTHSAGTTAVEASKSMKQIFSEIPNFAALEQSGQDQGRVHLSLDFFRKVLITKEVFQSSKRCRSRFDALRGNASKVTRIVVAVVAPRH